MAVLSSADRKEMSKSEFAGPGRSFPVNDDTHARMAISGATRSEHAGNISQSEEESIKAKARAKLGDKGGDPPMHEHKSAVAKMHPEHVHHLVKAAHEGKFGPEAQQMAQHAMQPAPMEDDGGGQEQGGRNYADMFSGQGPQEEPTSQSSGNPFE